MSGRSLARRSDREEEANATVMARQDGGRGWRTRGRRTRGWRTPNADQLPDRRWIALSLPLTRNATLRKATKPFHAFYGVMTPFGRQFRAAPTLPLTEEGVARAYTE